MLINLDKLFRRRVIRPASIVHCGAHLAEERAVYHRHCRGPIVWIEAFPETFNRMAQNVSKYQNQIPLCACLSDVDGQEVTFHISSNDGMSSSMLKPKTHLAEHPDVKFEKEVKLTTIRFDTLINASGIKIPANSFLNIDVQGAELMVLRGMGELLNRFSYAYLEVNERELYAGVALLPELNAYLAEFGFVPIESKMMPQGWGDCYYAKRYRPIL